MCKTKRYFESVGTLSIWTLRTVFVQDALSETAITFHFELDVQSEACLTIAFVPEKEAARIVYLSLQVTCDGSSFSIPPSFSAERILSSLCDETKLGGLERLPEELSEFVMEIPCMLESMNSCGVKFAHDVGQQYETHVNQKLAEVETS